MAEPVKGKDDESVWGRTLWHSSRYDSMSVLVVTVVQW